VGTLNRDCDVFYDTLYALTDMW